MQTKIVLIPSPLGDETDPINLIYDEVAKKFDFYFFFVESRKVPINVINQIYPDRDKELKISILDKSTSSREIDQFIRDVDGSTVGIITDAGLPGISDPGTLFIRKCHQKNYDVIPLVASSSITAALSASGLRGERFEYHGYLEREKEMRIEQIKAMEERSKDTEKTQIFIETPYRNIHMWKDLLNFCSPHIDLSISVDLFTKKQFIKTAKIVDWTYMKWPKLDDHQAVFLLNAKPLI